MNHADVQAHLADYLEGDLSLGERALLDAHLDACVECAAEVEAMRETIGLLRNLPEPEVPAHFASRVMRRIEEGEGQPTPLDHVRSFFEFLTSPRVLAPASAFAVAAGLLLWTGQWHVLIPGGGIGADPVESAQQAMAQNGTGTVLAPGTRIVIENPATATARDSRTFVVAGTNTARGSDRSGVQRREPLIVLEGPTVHRPSAFGGPIDRGLSVPVVSQRPHTARGPYFESPLVLEGASRRPTAFSPRGADLDSSGGGAPSTRDDWLGELQRNPGRFAQRMSRLTIAEQELWVDRLARRALEQGTLVDVAERLRAEGGPPGRLLADDFEAVGVRVSSE